jgi:hypothetical protein
MARRRGEAGIPVIVFPSVLVAIIKRTMAVLVLAHDDEDPR